MPPDIYDRLGVAKNEIGSIFSEAVSESFIPSGVLSRVLPGNITIDTSSTASDNSDLEIYFWLSYGFANQTDLSETDASLQVMRALATCNLMPIAYFCNFFFKAIVPVYKLSTTGNLLQA